MTATLAARVLARGLSRAGVAHAVVSPGSRSTPLVLALEELRREGRCRVEVAVDERAAAFFALGAARAGGEPVAVVATSGSAPAHWHPALVEASLAGLPLLAISADRPPELADCGASQTVPQPGMFGPHVRASWDLPPAGGDEELRAVARRAAQAVALARGPAPGPVHLNARFRKPLERPSDPAEAERIVASSPRIEAPAAVAPIAAVAELARRRAASRRPLVVAGPARGGAGAVGVAAHLAAALRAPLVAEPTAGAGPDALPHLDTLARAGAFEAYDPDLVVEVGLPPVSGAYAALAEGWGPRRVSVPGAVDLADPTNLASLVVLGALDPALLPPFQAPEAAALASLRAAARAAARSARRAIGPDTDGAAVAAVAGALPDGADLLVGNSLVVRDLDVFAPPLRARVLHQRGAAGIDGLVAGAAGGAWAGRRPTAVLLGDVSFAHDAASLAVAARAASPLAVVVLDNGGGRIFARLPARDALDAEAFERVFTTPTPLEHAALARAYGVEHREVSTSALAREVAAALERPRATLLVVRTRTAADAWAAIPQLTRAELARTEEET